MKKLRIPIAIGTRRTRRDPLREEIIQTCLPEVGMHRGVTENHGEGDLPRGIHEILRE